MGFNIRHYKDQTTKTGWKLLIKPSKKSVLNIRSKLRSEWLNSKGKSVDAVIKKLLIAGCVARRKSGSLGAGL